MTEDKRLALLITGCRQMEESSQLELYRYFYSYGMGICLRYAPNRESALEMLNDGFLKVFLKIKQYNSSKPFKPWLRQILVHAAIDHHRKYESHRSSESLLRVEPGMAHNAALDQLAFDDLLLVMQQLPPVYRMVFNLYVVDGLTHAEIAQQLGISVGTSKSNLAKARQKIKVLLSRSHGIHFKSEKYG